jgi:hypothetical protein
MVADAVEAALSLGLAELVVGDDQVLPAERQVEQWDVPAGDRQALSRWGLPMLVRMRFDIAQYDRLDAFLGHVRRIDRRAADEPSSLWHGVVAGW